MFYNLSGYDAHLFIKELERRLNKNDVGVIGENKEKYTSFNVKINFQLAGVMYKDGTEVCKNIQLRQLQIYGIKARKTGKQCIWYK